MTVVSLVVWAGVAIFFIAAVAKMVRFARMPMHLRWELYPVPHEAGRADYGGSFAEEVDWWTKELPEDKPGELKEMGKEILLLKGVHETNRTLWLWSWLLHVGMYVLCGTVALLAVGSIVEIVTGTALTAGTGFWKFVAGLTQWVCWIGVCASFLGTLGVLVLRLTSEKLKNFTSPFMILNLIYMLLLFGIGVCARLTVDGDASLLRATIVGVMTFNIPAGVPYQVLGELIGFSFFLAYLPFTFMSHMYMKYFTYHSVRWDDHARRPDDPTDPRLMEYLKWPVTWSAKHVTKDGRHKTWADVVMDREVEK